MIALARQGMVDIFLSSSLVILILDTLVAPRELLLPNPLSIGLLFEMLLRCPRDKDRWIWPGLTSVRCV